MRFLIIILSLGCSLASAAELKYGDILQVYFLRNPVARFNALVAAVNYPDQVFDRQDVFLARVENGKIVERGAANDSATYSGFVTTKTRELFESARLGEDKRHYVGEELAVFGKLVLIYENNLARSLHKPAAEILIFEGGHGFDPEITVSGKISGKTVAKQTIFSTVSGLISKAPANGMVFRLPGENAVSFRRDGRGAGNALVILPGEALHNTVISYERGASRFNGGGEYLGKDARVVIGAWTKNGIIPKDVVRGVLNNDQFYIANHVNASDSRLLIDLKKGAVISLDGSEIEIKASKADISSSARHTSIFKYAATEELYRNAIPKEDEPIQPRLMSKCALALKTMTK